jgi:hypothetical protein
MILTHMRQYSDIYLEGLRKNTINRSLDSHSSDQNFNSGLFEHERRILTLRGGCFLS